MLRGDGPKHHAYSGIAAHTGTTAFPSHGEGAPTTRKEAYAALDTFVGPDKPSRRLGKSRKVRREERGGKTLLILSLYDTDVLTYWPDGSVEIDWGGWHTLTTNNTIHDHLPYPFGVSGHASLVVLGETDYYAVPLYAVVRIDRSGRVGYRDRRDADAPWTLAAAYPDWRQAEREARKIAHTYQ